MAQRADNGTAILFAAVLIMLSISCGFGQLAGAVKVAAETVCGCADG